MAKAIKKRTHSKEAPPPRRSDEGNAFIPDPYDGNGARAHANESLAETLAEDFVMSVTSAEGVVLDEVSPEELGGPFTETSAQEEFASGSDASNPLDAAREPFPTATHPTSTR